jgi:hypothetical protein
MHVHVSRSVVSRCSTIRLARFLHSEANVGFVEALAGRRLRGSEWAAIDPGYAQLWAFADYAHRHPLYGNNRYTALNVQNEDTLEFRLFASTMDADRACANVEACAALVAFCVVAARSLASAASADDFQTFVAANAAQYPHLAKLLAALASSSTTAQAA